MDPRQEYLSAADVIENLRRIMLSFGKNLKPFHACK
jgi:hypothetical protein